MSGFVLAIDQGTTSSRALLFDAALGLRAVAQQEFAQHYPAPGWVEHDPEDLWTSALTCARQVLAKAGLGARDVAAIGITNQRETTLVWDRASGKPLHRAIVWQDRRTAPLCDELRAEGLQDVVRHKTGLLLDPYFSATKLAWILDAVPGARAQAAAGKLAFGTVDSYLIWRLTGGRAHLTDATNAARTMLYDIRRGCWDVDLCARLGVPLAMLPEVRDCADDFGMTDPELFGGAIAIRGVAGDQQAATVGQACFDPGMLKATYGTGCFALLNTGTELVESRNRLLGTIAYQLEGKPVYALEGSIFVAGAAVQWLRDGLGVIAAPAQTQALAEAADSAQELVLVPAFTGLGAPHWAPGARGALFGLTRNSGPAELARAALQSVGFQTRDLLQAMQADWRGMGKAVLRVDGGMAASDWTMQFLADILGAPVDRPAVLETTALGVAWLAGMQAGLCAGQAEFAGNWSAGRRFAPAMAEPERAAKYARWQRAVAATLAF
jgi:glycerol kinase